MVGNKLKVSQITLIRNFQTMPLYPSESHDGHGADDPRLVKQGVTAAVLTVLLATGWWYVGQLGLALADVFKLGTVDSQAGLLSLSWLSGSSVWTGLGVGAVILGLLWSLIVLETLLVPRFWIRLVPLLTAPIVLLLMNIEAGAWMAGIAILAQLFYTSDVRRSLTIFRKLNLMKVALPASGGLFLGISVMLMVPLYFYISEDSGQLEEVVEQKFIAPQVEGLLGREGLFTGLAEDQIGTLQDQLNIGSLLRENSTLDLSDDQQAVLNRLKADGQLGDPSGFPDQELGDVFFQNISNEIDAGLVAKQEELKTQVIQQAMDFLRPIFKFAYIVIPLIFGLSLWQLSGFLRPILFIVPWVVMELVYLLRIASVVSRKEPVEYFQI